MNDFYDLLIGDRHLGFDRQLNNVFIEILNENKILFTYSVANIMREQFKLEHNNNDKITFIGEKLLQKLKEAIMNKKEELTKLFDYEGAFYNNGLMGVYESFDENIFKSTGKHIL